jgi:glycosyltransferase involved in cell wall biosynthesis
MRRAPLILHVFPTFAIGGQQARTVDIINHLDRPYRHAVVALDGDYGCRERLKDDVQVEFPGCEVRESWLAARLAKIRTHLRAWQPDLLLTYNWGAIEWAMANRIRPLCRHIHHEGGFGAEEADRQLPRRILFRRLALARTACLVVPSHRLVEIATGSWKLPGERVLHIANGIDCTKFGPGRPGNPAGPPSEPPEPVVVGTVAPMRPEKDLSFLLRAFGRLPQRPPCRLLLVGDGPERGRLMDLARTLEIEARVTFAGHSDTVEQVLPAIDVFALTSSTEQMPNSLLQAMAAGRAVVSLDVGDVKRMLAPANRAFVASKGDGEGFDRRLARLVEDGALRAHLGEANRAHVQANYPFEVMVQAYERLFEATAARS